MPSARRGVLTQLAECIEAILTSRERIQQQDATQTVRALAGERYELVKLPTAVED